MTVELQPLCAVDIVMADPIVIGDGPAGTRVIVDLEEATFTGECLHGRAKGKAAADSLTIGGGVATMDVRAAFVTDDGAVVYVQYRGRADFSGGPGAAPICVAPTFETADERYRWLNGVQAVAKGALDGSYLHYDWYEIV
jgi:hypothetical protein